MSAVIDRTTRNLNNSPRTEDNTFFPPLEAGWELVSEHEYICPVCKAKYYRRISISPSRIVDSHRTKCLCFTEETEEESRKRQFARSRTVQIEVEKMFAPWNLLNDESLNHMRLEKFRLENKSHGQAMNILKNYEPLQRNIVLIGLPGRGKTHLAVALLRKLKTMGYSVLAIKSIDMLNRIKRCYDSRNDDLEIAVIGTLKKVDVLLIDDIGVEQATKWVLAKFYEIIDYRSEHRSTIYTTNLDGDDMVKKLGQALTSRINKNAAQIVVDGRDWRVTQDLWSDIATEVFDK